MTLIVTPGSKGHVDIDGAACAIALYQHYQNIGRKDLGMIFSDNYTASIVKRYLPYINSFSHTKPRDGDEIILVDVSDVEFLEKECSFNMDSVIEIFDHHFLYEEYWKNKIGDKACIEEIGAAATQVARYIIENNGFAGISNDTKELLACAILSNSANFTLSMTKAEDKQIFLRIMSDLGYDSEMFTNKYFQEVDDNYLEQPKFFLENDMKTVTIGGRTVKISQVEMTDNIRFINENMKSLEKISEGEVDYSFLITSSALNQVTYFVSFDENTKTVLEKVLGLPFQGDILKYEGVMLRKEIVKKFKSSLSTS